MYCDIAALTPWIYLLILLYCFMGTTAENMVVIFNQC